MVMKIEIEIEIDDVLMVMQTEIENGLFYLIVNVDQERELAIAIENDDVLVMVTMIENDDVLTMVTVIESENENENGLVYLSVDQEREIDVDASYYHLLNRMLQLLVCLYHCQHPHRDDHDVDLPCVKYLQHHQYHRLLLVMML
jgi:hypothetical protein